MENVKEPNEKNGGITGLIIGIIVLFVGVIIFILVAANNMTLSEGSTSERSAPSKSQQEQKLPVEMVDIKTGYGHYNYMVVPAVRIKFKNTSGKDITNYTGVNVIFVDDDAGEQIGAEYKNIGNVNFFVAGTTVEETFAGRDKSFYDYKSSNVSARIFMFGKVVKTIRIENKAL